MRALYLHCAVQTLDLGWSTINSLLDVTKTCIQCTWLQNAILNSAAYCSALVLSPNRLGCFGLLPWASIKKEDVPLFWDQDLISVQNSKHALYQMNIISIFTLLWGKKIVSLASVTWASCSSLKDRYVTNCGKYGSLRVSCLFVLSVTELWLYLLVVNWDEGKCKPLKTCEWPGWSLNYSTGLNSGSSPSIRKWPSSILQPKKENPFEPSPSSGGACL